MNQKKCFLPWVSPEGKAPFAKGTVFNNSTLRRFLRFVDPPPRCRSTHRRENDAGQGCSLLGS